MLMFKPFFKYADFTGRARRLEFWSFQLFQMLVYVGLVALMFSGAVSGDARALAGGLAGLGFLVIFALATFLPNLAVTVRRLHDTGRSGWWLLLYAPAVMAQASNFETLAALGQHDTGALIAAASRSTLLGLIGMVCNLVMFVFMCWGGTRGTNRFGPDPKGDVTDIARVFDAPEPDLAPETARPTYTEPHKPVFDFGPTPAARPATRDYTPPPRPAPTSSAPARPTFGKRR